MTLAQVKTSMGISGTAKDSDITIAMNAAVNDLHFAGVNISTIEGSDLLDIAIDIYCKAYLNYQGRADEFSRQYTALKNTLALAAPGGRRC